MTMNEPEKVGALIEQRDGKWNEAMVRSLFDDQRVKKILATPIGLPSTVDKMMWINNKSGVYSVKSGYFTTRNQAANPQTTIASSSHQTKPDLWKFIWKSKTLPRVKQFFWNACHNALPTVDNLHRRRIVPDPLWPICKKEAETIEHALLLCPWTVQIWRARPFDLIATTVWCI